MAGVDRHPLKKLEPDPEGLLRLLRHWQDEAVLAGCTITRIAVAFEACLSQHVARIIPAVMHGRLQVTEKGVHARVEIVSATGGRMRLRFRSAILPERGDGI